MLHSFLHYCNIIALKIYVTLKSLKENDENTIWGSSMCLAVLNTLQYVQTLTVFFIVIINNHAIEFFFYVGHFLCK